ncbi:hypothetical protein, partial [Gemmiger sp.]
MNEKFLSTPPSRVATDYTIDAATLEPNFYPRHPRGWRRSRQGAERKRQGISIHATLAGGDGCTFQMIQEYQHISIHATLAGNDVLRSIAM